jgi:hypothetical protein
LNIWGKKNFNKILDVIIHSSKKCIILSSTNVHGKERVNWAKKWGKGTPKSFQTTSCSTHYLVSQYKQTMKGENVESIQNFSFSSR